MEPRDADAVCALITQLGYERPVDEVLAWIAGLPAREGTQIGLVACVGAAVVGWIEASVERHLQTPPQVLIGGLVVRDGVRGAGIGRLLCEAVEKWTMELGIAKVKVTSRSTREAAHRFYLRDGYRVVKTSLVFEKSVGNDGGVTAMR
jgi:GNAT superfamily N-acetyltransferase